MDFDEISELIKDYLQKDKGKILKPIRYAGIIESYKTLKIIFNNDCDETTLEILDCALQTGDIAIEITSPMLSAYNITLLTKAFQKADEYSCAVTPPVRQTGNRLSRPTETARASLLT